MKITKLFYKFVKPSFIEGIGRIFDFGNILNHQYKSVDDDTAIEQDWKVIEQDFYDTIENYWDIEDMY